MVSQSSASINQLSWEAELSRNQVVTTVSDLNEKLAETIADVKTSLSPSHIKEELKGYVRDESSQILSSIQRKARDNPLQAVALGAAVIYPFWGILKSIPVPMLLLGGGIWLSQQKNGEISQAVSGKADDLAHSLENAKESVIAEAGAVADTIGNTTQGIIDEAVDRVSANMSDVSGTAVRVTEQSRTAFDDLIHENPLLVGGIALAIGAFVAASIPISQAENRLFGDRSGEVKDKALETLSNGVERAKDVAADIVGDIAAAAAREGLTREGISQSVEGTTGAVRAVLDKGLTAALGDRNGAFSSSDPSSNNLN